MDERKPAMVLVGNRGVEHIGRHLADAAEALGAPLRFCDSTRAYEASSLKRRVNWWLRGRLPSRLRQFSMEVAAACADFHPQVLLTTGIAPVDAEGLRAIGRTGAIRMNFLTDDPWNPAHRAEWFFRALRDYDIVFTPREANLGDLRRCGCGEVRYLPFAYAPGIHFREESLTPEERAGLAADVVFAGGADAERLPYASALVKAGIGVALYGGYWNRHRETRPFARGNASPEVLRKAIHAARISLCLVRRANRDGHAMRTFELAAMGACILAEDTPEHRRILGAGDVSAAYFRSIPEMIEKAKALLADEPRRARMGAAVQARIRGGSNSYTDRLGTIWEHLQVRLPEAGLTRAL